MGAELLTVKEYAKRKKVSVQSVYKQLNKGKLKKVEKVENDKTVIYVEVSAEEAQDTIQPQFSTIQPQVENHSTNEIVDFYRTELERLRAQVEEKDRIINEKTNELLNLANRFADLAQQAQQITTQEQVIRALDKPKETEEETEEEKTQAQEKEKTFFQRFFSRK